MNNREETVLKNPYFDIQVKSGVTKHMGGPKATKELADLCNIDEDKYVLVVGCGNGVSACKIAMIYGCRIVGIDISEGMVEKSGKRSEKEVLTDRVEFSDDKQKAGT